MVISLRSGTVCTVQSPLSSKQVNCSSVNDSVMMTDDVKMCQHDTVEEFHNHLVAQMIVPRDICQVSNWVSQFYSIWRQLTESGQITQRHAGACEAVKKLLEASSFGQEFHVITVRDLKPSTDTCNSGRIIRSGDVDSLTPNVTDILIGRLAAETPRSSKHSPCICLSDSTGKICVKLRYEHVRQILPMLGDIVCITGWTVVTGNRRQSDLWLTVDEPLIPLSSGGAQLQYNGRVKCVSAESAHTLLHLSSCDAGIMPLVSVCGTVEAVSEVIRIRDKCIFMVRISPEVNIVIKTPALMYWQLFLLPDQSYMITNLKSTSLRKGCSYKMHVYTVTERSELLINDDEVSIIVSVEDWLKTSHFGRLVLPRLSECMPVPPDNNTHLLTYQGEVTAVLDMVLGVYELDEGVVRLFVGQVPAVHHYEALQTGTSVVVHNAHHRTAANQTYHMVLYCCMRSSIHVVKYNSVFKSNKIRPQTVSLLQYQLGQGHLDWLYNLRKILIGSFCGMLGNRVVESLFKLILSEPRLSWQQSVKDKLRNYLDEFLLEPHDCGLQTKHTQMLPTYVSLTEVLDSVPTSSHCSTENWKYHRTNYSSQVLLGVLGLSTHTGRPVLRDHHTSADIVCCFHGDDAVDVAPDCGCACDCRQHRPGQRLPCPVLHTCCVGKLIAVTEFMVISESTSRDDGRETVTRTKYISIDLRKCFILANENLEQNVSSSFRSDGCKRSNSGKLVDAAMLTRSGLSSDTVCKNVRTDIKRTRNGKFDSIKVKADCSKSDRTIVRNTCDNGSKSEIDKIPQIIGSHTNDSETKHVKCYSLFQSNTCNNNDIKRARICTYDTVCSSKTNNNIEQRVTKESSMDRFSYKSVRQTNGDATIAGAVATSVEIVGTDVVAADAVVADSVTVGAVGSSCHRRVAMESVTVLVEGKESVLYQGLTSKQATPHFCLQCCMLEEDKQKQKVVLLFQGQTVKWYPVLHQNRFYKFFIPAECSPLLKSLSNKKVEKVVRSSKGRQMYVVHEDVVVEQLFDVPASWVGQYLSNGTCVAIADVLRSEFAETVVNICGTIVSRQMVDSCHGRGIGEASIQLQLEDQAGECTIQVHIGPDRLCVPLGMVPGSRVYFTHLERKSPRSSASVYCRFLPVSAMVVLHMCDTITNRHPIVPESTCDPAIVSLNNPGATNHDMPMLSVADVFTRLYMGSQRSQGLGDSNTGHSNPGLFQRVCDVTQVIKLSLKCVCAKCASMIVNSCCPNVSCDGNGTSRFNARASVLVEDGTFVAMVMMTSDCVQRLLHMSQTEWADLEEEVGEQGEVFLQRTSCGDTELGQFLSKCLDNSLIKHSWSMLLKVKYQTTKDLYNADLNEFPKKTFNRGSVSVTTHCLPILQLQCVAMEMVDSTLLATQTLIQGTT